TRSAWVDAVVVGAGDLARSARLAGADPARVVARANRRVQSLATRHGKVWAVVAYSAAQEQRARQRGARLIVRGTEQTIPVSGIRARAMPARRRRPLGR